MLTQTLPTILPFLLLLHQLPQLLFQLLFQLVWILRGFIGDSCVPLTYAYILIDYLESTWLYSTCYPREMWNMYESVKNKDPRTNNVSEGGNNAINIAAGVSHPKIVPFIKIIQRFNAEHESDLQQFTTGANPHRRRSARRTRTIERDDRILAIVTSNDGFNLLSYLRRVATYTSELILFMFVNRRVFHS